MSESMVIQQPQGVAGQLLLLFHGIGSVPGNLAALGSRLAARLPSALVVSVRAPERFEFGAGYQWFSVDGISDENRPERVALAMPGFVAEVKRWQQSSGVDRAATALIGYSQGAIMCLESTGQGGGLAGRVISLSGRFATIPAKAPAEVTIHMIHGKTDAVTHYGYTVQTAERLIELGGDLTADVIPFAGHGVNDAMIDLAIERLTGYVPKRLWDAALSDEALSSEASPVDEKAPNGLA